LSVALRTIWILAVNSTPVSDASWYFEKGLEIASGKGYINNGVPTAYWPVGYPAFLGLVFYVFGPSLFAGKLANIILYAGVLVCSYYCATVLLRSKLAGKITLLLLAFYPNQIAYSSLLLSETLFLFLLMSGSLLLILPSRQNKILFICSGVIWGLATLVKPQVVLLPFIYLVICFWKKREGFLNAIILYSALFLTVLPWIVRNVLVFGSFVFVSTNGGINLLIGNNPYATGNYHYNDMVESLVDRSFTNEVSIDNNARGAAIKFLEANPTAFFSLAPQKIYYLFESDIEGIIWNQRGLPPASLNLMVFLEIFKLFARYYYLLLLALGGIGTILFRMQKTKILIMTIIFYLIGINIVFFGDARFHFAIMPWIVMIGVSSLVQERKELRFKMKNEPVVGNALFGFQI
jgi:hypothetical protein